VRSRRRRAATTERRVARWGGGALVAAALLLAAAPQASTPVDVEVVATGLSRPLQLALDRRTLVVLGPGARGDSAGEIYRLDLDGALPVDFTHRPRVRVPYLDRRLATLGSLALEPATRDLYLGEENGTRVYRLDGDERLTLYVDGLHRLPGGSALAFDASGRLVIVDHADPLLSAQPERPPAGLEQFRDEDYRGPLVFRLTLDPTLPLPRRVDRIPPLFPRAWGGRAGGAMLPRIVAATPAGDGLVVLSSGGTLYRLANDTLTPLATLPRGQYLRANLIAGPEGTVIMNGGFGVPMIFRIAVDGAVTQLAGPLGDPQGLVLTADGYLYVAESSLHRIVRFRVNR
jgi:hypothetical protein